MSADNYIVIYYEPDGKYRGYMGFASQDYGPGEMQSKPPLWEASTMHEACEKADGEVVLEYGYHFESYGPDDQGAGDEWRKRYVRLRDEYVFHGGEGPSDVLNRIGKTIDAIEAEICYPSPSGKE